MARVSSRAGSVSAREDPVTVQQKWHRGILFTVAVAIGGAFGALARMLITVLMHPEAGSIFSPQIELALIDTPFHFPLGVLLINIVGSFALGFVIAKRLYAPLTSWSVHREAWFLAVTSGFWSAFTTFSAFSYGITELWGNGAMIMGHWWPGEIVVALYILFSVIIALMAVMLAFLIARKKYH